MTAEELREDDREQVVMAAYARLIERATAAVAAAAADSDEADPEPDAPPCPAQCAWRAPRLFSGRWTGRCRYKPKFTHSPRSPRGSLGAQSPKRMRTGARS